MFGYMQSIDLSRDFYIKEYGNMSVTMSQKAYDPSKRDIMILRSIQKYFGYDSKLLWIGDFHSETVSHADIVFKSNSNYAFLGTNVYTYMYDDPNNPIRPTSDIIWNDFQKAYYAKENKDKIVLYIHEPACFIDTSLKKSVSADEAWTWIKNNVIGPVVIRMDCKKLYDGCIPKGKMAYIPYERKCSLRYLVYFSSGSELDWTKGENYDVVPFLNGYNLVTRASPMFGRPYDDALYAFMQKSVPRDPPEKPSDIVKQLNALALSYGVTCECDSKCTSKTIQFGEIWETKIRFGPLETGFSVSDTKIKSMELSYNELIGLLDGISVDDKKLARGCC
ncbi:VP9 [Kundal virus]|nr:VP9 [Kundal virus]AXG65502.1 VP9 [Kundal virus]